MKTSAKPFGLVVGP